MLSGHVAILRALDGLGDFLCLTPALRALRRNGLVSRVTLVGSPPSRAHARRFPHLVDDVVTFPGFPGIVEQPLDRDALARTIGTGGLGEPVDWAIQMHGNGSVMNAFLALMNARRLAGYHLPGLWAPDPTCFFPFPDELPEPSRWLSLVERLGCPVDDGQLEFPVEPADREAASALLGARAGGYAVVHAGASAATKCWPAANFAIVADGLAARGLRVVLTGSAAERGTVAALRSGMAADGLDLAGATDLGTLAAIVAGARLLVSNDTGVSHLAAALSTPSVVIFTASDRDRWAPLDRERHRAVGGGQPDPRVGSRTTSERSSPATVDEVLAAVDRQLSAAATLPDAA